MIYPNSLYLATFQENWQETQQARRVAGASPSTVTDTLQRYQDANKWPKSGIPLPQDMLEVVKRRKFGETHLGVFYVLSFLGLMALTAAFYFVIDLSIKGEEGVGVVPFVLGAVGILVLMVSCAGCAVTKKRWPELHDHVEALHLMYVYEMMPMKENPGQEEAFRVKIGPGKQARVFRVLENGHLFYEAPSTMV